MKYTENFKFEEKMLEKKECILESDNSDFSNKLFFVVRGQIVQKDGEYETPGP
jgi:hypothetical protein